MSQLRTGLLDCDFGYVQLALSGSFEEALYFLPDAFSYMAEPEEGCEISGSVVIFISIDFCQSNARLSAPSGGVSLVAQGYGWLAHFAGYEAGPTPNPRHGITFAEVNNCADRLCGRDLLEQRPVQLSGVFWRWASRFEARRVTRERAPMI